MRVNKSFVVVRGCLKVNQSVAKMFGLLFTSCTLAQASEMIVDAGEKREKCLVVTPNVDHIVMLEDDAEMRAIYEKARFCFADGMPLIWLSKLLKRPLQERVTGADLLPAVAAIAAKRGVKLFLLGGMPGVVEKASKKLCAKHPNLEISGIYCPPFGFEHDEIESLKIVKMINNSGADILFVGVGAPKQEKWAAKHLGQLDSGPILGVGAAFDFVAGSIKRAPLFIQRIGFEWFWRLLHDPKRLWRRYLMKDPLFLALSLREWRKG